jgi:small subunit ribosomal protein S13
MTHFLNVDIKEKKYLEIALSGIYGIGRKEAIKVCKHLGLNSKKKFKELNNKILTNLSNYIEFNYIQGFHLKRLKKQNISSLIKLKCYKGNRHFNGLLVRGQKSKNKKTRRHL